MGADPFASGWWAQGPTRTLLASLGDRLRHVQAVGRKAESVQGILEREDGEALVAAAHLHDIGYAPALWWTGLHQLDGAEYLRSQGHERLACLVAHHSEARFEVLMRGFGEMLAAYPREESAVCDALSWCDLTTGPTGRDVTLEERLREVEHRYGPDSLVVRALQQSRQHLAAAVQRTERRLRRAGIQVAGHPR